MSDEKLHLTRVLRHIKRGEDIPHALMNLAINEITDTSFTKHERNAASQISESAGTQLEAWALIDFISAKYTDEEVKAIIETRQIFVSRLSVIAPSMIDMLRLTEINDVSSAIHQIYHCARDYAVIEKSQFSSQQRKKATKEVNSIIQLAEQLDDVLDQASDHVDIEFHRHKEAIARSYGSENELRNIDELRRDLTSLIFASKLTLYRDSVGERSFYVGDNKAKTHVVECAYRLALQFNMPPFKTTPGSDFSNFCSLIHELATGIQHESLAGAINKFARSPKRQEIDREEEVHRFENSDEGIAEYEADNFSAVKARIESLEAEEAFWRGMLSSGSWDKKTVQQASIRLADVIQQKQSAIKEHGPFLIWASQISRTTFDEWLQESERHKKKMLSLAVELGQRVRNRAD